MLKREMLLGFLDLKELFRYIICVYTVVMHVQRDGEAQMTSALTVGQKTATENRLAFTLLV